MGEAKFTHQTFLWHVRERGEDANLDRRLRLCAGGYHQNRIGAQCLALHFSTDFIGSLF
jgi:hypothetical protein